MAELTSFYKQQFASLKDCGEPWFDSLRQQALVDFEKIGLPDRHTEEWKYTPIKAITQANFEPTLEPAPLKVSHDRRLIVLRHGQLEVPDNLPSGVVILDILEAFKKYPNLVKDHFTHAKEKALDAFGNLNLALMCQGVFIHVAKDFCCDTPFEITFETTEKPYANHLRNLYVVEPGANINIIERYVGSDTVAYCNHVVTDIVLEKRASLSYFKVQQEGAEAFHIGNTNVYQAAESKIDCHSFSFGGALVRSDVCADLKAPNTNCTLNGFYIASAKQHIDHHTTLNHLSEKATSEELYKGILGGHARAVFNGNIYVARDAQKTDAKLQNKNLLLSDSAEVNTKPQLEIFADDVSCAHGTTVGQLDEKAVFYMRSRGIPVERARELLVHAFAGDLLERVSVDSLKKELTDCLCEKLRTIND